MISCRSALISLAVAALLTTGCGGSSEPSASAEPEPSVEPAESVESVESAAPLQAETFCSEGLAATDLFPGLEDKLGEAAAERVRRSTASFTDVSPYCPDLTVVEPVVDADRGGVADLASLVHESPYVRFDLVVLDSGSNDVRQEIFDGLFDDLLPESSLYNLAAGPDLMLISSWIDDGSGLTYEDLRSSVPEGPLSTTFEMIDHYQLGFFPTD